MSFGVITHEIIFFAAPLADEEMSSALLLAVGATLVGAFEPTNKPFDIDKHRIKGMMIAVYTPMKDSNSLEVGRLHPFAQ